MGHKTTYGQIRGTIHSEILFPPSLVQTRGLPRQIQTFLPFLRSGQKV